MKLHNAAALALAIWCLDAPFSGRNLDSGGYMLATFKTQDQCEKRKAEVHKPGFKWSDSSISPDLTKATCIGVAVGNRMNSHPAIVPLK